MTKKIFLIIIVVLIALIVVYAVKTKKKTSVAVISNPADPNNNILQFPIQQGSKGKAVKLLQLLFGSPVDGLFGKNTEAAIKNKYGKTVINEDDFKILITPTRSQFPIRHGSTGTTVKALQIMLDVEVTGNYLDKTEAAVMKAVAAPEVSESDYVRIINNTFGTDYDI